MAAVATIVAVAAVVYWVVGAPYSVYASKPGSSGVDIEIACDLPFTAYHDAFGPQQAARIEELCDQEHRGRRTTAVVLGTGLAVVGTFFGAKSSRPKRSHVRR